MNRLRNGYKLITSVWVAVIQLQLVAWGGTLCLFFWPQDHGQIISLCGPPVTQLTQKNGGELARNAGQIDGLKRSRRVCWRVVLGFLAGREGCYPPAESADSCAICVANQPENVDVAYDPLHLFRPPHSLTTVTQTYSVHDTHR